MAMLSYFPKCKKCGKFDSLAMQEGLDGVY